ATQGIDEGASAVSNAASHVGEAFVDALPTAPLRKIGDRLAAHIAGSDSAARRGNGKEAAADGIGKALGAALLGSAVAVDRKPVAKPSPILFIPPPGGKSATIYLIGIALLLLGVGVLVCREIGKALGLATPRAGSQLAAEGARPALNERLAVTLVAVRTASHH